MALDSYTNIKTSVAAWLARGNLTAYIPDFITMAEVRIYNEVRCKEIEVTFTDTISSGVISVPTGYKEMKNLRITSAPVQRLIRKKPGWIYEKYPLRSSDGKPLFFGRDGTSIVFGPYPDADYTVAGTYYKKLDPLSGSNETNWLTDDYPNLLLFAALSEAEPFLKNDTRVQLWEAKYAAIRDAINKASRKEEHSGSDLTIVAG